MHQRVSRWVWVKNAPHLWKTGVPSAEWGSLDVGASPADSGHAPHSPERMYTVVSITCSFLLCAHNLGPKLSFPQLGQPGEYFCQNIFHAWKITKTQIQICFWGISLEKSKASEVPLFWRCTEAPGCGAQCPGDALGTVGHVRGAHKRGFNWERASQIHPTSLDFRTTTALLESYSKKKEFLVGKKNWLEMTERKEN